MTFKGILTCIRNIWTQNTSDNVSDNGCINMMSVENVVTCVKDYGTLQPDLGKEPTSTERSLCIENPSDKPEALPCIPKGVLKCSGHNPYARATEKYPIVEDLGQNPYAMSSLESL